MLFRTIFLYASKMYATYTVWIIQFQRHNKYKNIWHNWRDDAAINRCKIKISLTNLSLSKALNLFALNKWKRSRSFHLYSKAGVRFGRANGKDGDLWFHYSEWLFRYWRGDLKFDGEQKTMRSTVYTQRESTAPACNSF